MSSILCLWKYPIYKRERREGLGDIPEYNSKQSRLHSATQLGETGYIVTYLKNHCYLVAKIIIEKKEHNDPGNEFGEFKIKGNPPQSSYFDDPIDITGIIRQLRFKTGKRIDNLLQPISLHLQTIRELTEDDEALLESCIP
jgi:hypothetical protein